MKLLEVVYIFALAACFAGNCACISNGTSVTDPNAYPFQAAVKGPVKMCNGAVVSSKIVVTAANCVHFLSPKMVKLHVGSNKYNSGGYTHSVDYIVINPKFDSGLNDNNIALVVSATQFESVVVPIPLATTPPDTNTTLFATAFGTVDPFNSTLPDTLQRAGLVAFGLTKCRTLKPAHRIKNSVFCAGDASGRKDLCPVDDGAPLVYENKLYGIYSWGCTCGLAAPNSSSPVFNLISHFGSWIRTNIKMYDPDFDLLGLINSTLSTVLSIL